MQSHTIQPTKSSENRPRSSELAWLLASVAADDAPLLPEVGQMIGNRLIDNTAVAVAALARRPSRTARAQALAHPYTPGACLYGMPSTVRVSPEWAAWYNAVAVRELDFHDTFLSAEFSHPGDNIAAVLAAAQHCGRSGAQFARGVATAYEVQVDLAKSISLWRHKIDHVSHLGASTAAGVGAALDLPAEVIYQAIQQAVYVTTGTLQVRKGEISSWKAFACGYAGKVAIEAIDRAMRGEGAPSPVYEGEAGIIATYLGGPDDRYEILLPEPGAPKRAILDTYTKAHSAEYFAQPFIDLGSRMRDRIGDLSQVAGIVVHSNRHMHNFIGTSGNEPQKMNPKASRETLDHSMMYLLAIVLEDGAIHHHDSYTPERAARPSTVTLWHKISTAEDPEWSRRYDSIDPEVNAIGGRIVVTMNDGRVIEDEIRAADAHPYGARPFAREDYVAKFRMLTDGVVSDDERDRFLDAVDRLTSLAPGELDALNITVDETFLGDPAPSGLFDWAS